MSAMDIDRHQWRRRWGELVRLWQGGRREGRATAGAPSARCEQGRRRTPSPPPQDLTPRFMESRLAFDRAPRYVYVKRFLRRALLQHVRQIQPEGFRVPISFLGNFIFVFGSTHYLDSLYWVERVEHWLTQNRPTCILSCVYQPQPQASV